MNFEHARAHPWKNATSLSEIEFKHDAPVTRLDEFTQPTDAVLDGTTLIGHPDRTSPATNREPVHVCIYSIYYELENSH